MNRKNLTWFTLGSLASSALSFISIPIIAWVFFDADIGKVALLLSTSGLATIIFSLGLDQSYTREFNETGDRAALLLNVIAPGAALLLLTALSGSIWVFFFMRTEISHRNWRKMPRRSIYFWTLGTLALAVGHALGGDQAGDWLAGAWTVFLAVGVFAFRDSLRSGAKAILSMADRRHTSSVS